ncbi:MAG: polysaccharide synthesis protein GtrA [Lysobacteraceae bacterium]|nr:MAG: polysaccharide synthesis protein GtrA [Xanthomonadaceae bacterium]
MNAPALSSDTRPAALIPAYKPCAGLVPLVEALLASEAFCQVVVVDDGSGPEYAEIFAALPASPRLRVLGHYVNLGKGAALKTGINAVGRECPMAVGVVTLDADGQHAVADVLAVARRLVECPQALVLGCRGFDRDVPMRSRIGNTVTRWVMRAAGGLRISDTQTGLRGIPRALFPVLLRLRTRGYDFELDMLLSAREAGLTIVEVPIRTIYIDGNRSSHFNPLLDSLRIYYVFLRFNLSSLSAFVVDYSLFVLLRASGGSLELAQFGARLVSSLFNYAVNRRLVFRSDRGLLPSLALYYGTALLIAACSYGLILLLEARLGMSVYTAKLLADSVLYVASFAIQREFVFRRLDRASTEP